jgi:amino acid transporter
VSSVDDSNQICQSGRSKLAKKDTNKKSKNRYKLSLITFTLITGAALLQTRDYPTMAVTGWNTIVFNLLAAIMFLIPCALVAAELATGWPGEGGVYIWVKEAFGEHWGFTASWLQWFQMTIAFVTILAFIAGVLAYIFNPALADSKLFIFLIIILVWWGVTFVDFRGLKTSSWISSIFLIFGVFLPMTILVVGGATYIASGAPINLTLPPTWNDLLPNFTDLRNLVLLVTFTFTYTGIEITSAHAEDMKNVHRDYPLGVFVIGVIAAASSIIGSLVVGLILPVQNLVLTAGLMQTYETIFSWFGFNWMVPIIAVLIAIGSIGKITTWVLGPVRGLGRAAREGLLPPLLQKHNKAGVPVSMLILQAVIVSLWGVIFVLLPGGVNSAFWMLLALTTTVYIVMYVLMYLAAIKLRYSQSNVRRAFTIPGGKAGMWIISGWGIGSMITIFILALFPPTQANVESISLVVFEALMIAGTISVVLVPQVIYWKRNSSWHRKKQSKQEKKRIQSKQLTR